MALDTAFFSLFPDIFKVGGPKPIVTEKMEQEVEK